MKISSIITTVLSVLLLVSCQEKYALYPEQYNRILSIKNSGVRDLHIGNSPREYEDQILVLKSGGNPDGEARGQIALMDLDKACKAFGYDKSEVKIVREASYSFKMGTDISIAGTAHNQYVPVVFSPSEINRQATQSPGKTMILPLELQSETDAISATNSMLLYRFDVNGATVVWPDASDLKAEIVYTSLDYELAATVEHYESNSNTFVGKVSTTGLLALVEAYNSAHSTSYKLLPTSAWSFDGFNVPAKTANVKGTLHLNRTSLTADETYLLPLQFDYNTYPIGASTDVRYLVVTNPKYCYQTIERTDWSLVFVNSQENWYGSALADQWFATYAFDGRPSTTWGTEWDSPAPDTFANGDDYDYNPSDTYLHSIVPTLFKGSREVPNILMVIDLGREYNLGGAGILQSVKENERKIQKCEVYAASSFTFKTYQAGGTTANYNTLTAGNSWTLLNTKVYGVR